jgi:uncharacterized membrane protein
MDRKTFWAGGALIGAGLMALFDPGRGRRRRALLRDRAAGAADAVGNAAGKTWRDLRHRAEGVAARGRGLFDREAAGSDALAARVRSRIGRLTSHPRAISVEARDGAVVVSGPILAREAEGVIAGVRAVRGVVSVEDRLDLHERAEGIPALQGPGRRRRRELLRESWSPTARLIGGAAGVGLIVAGARRRGWLGGGMAAAGVGLLSRAATNRPARRLLGLARSRANVEVRKEISIGAPIEEVYAFWERWENFPRFFEHVRDVRDEGGGWTRWTVAGPAGVEILFDAVVTAAIPNHLIAWKTAPRQAVRHAGLIRFEEVSPGVTRVDVQMSYDPPAGQLGQAVASLFGTDPKSALDDDLLRLKSLLEDRGTAAQGREVGLEGTRAETGSAPFLGESRGGGAPSEEEAAAPREESLEPRPEEAIVAAQDAGIEPLIQTEPGQAEDPSAESGAAAEPEKPPRRRSRKRRPEGTDQADL